MELFCAEGFFVLSAIGEHDDELREVRGLTPAVLGGAPIGACSVSDADPGLTPWAKLCRRCAGGLCGASVAVGSALLSRT